MGRFIIRRLLWMSPGLICRIFVTFFLMHQVPGGPFDREKALPPEIMANLERARSPGLAAAPAVRGLRL